MPIQDPCATLRKLCRSRQSAGSIVVGVFCRNDQSSLTTAVIVIKCAARLDAELAIVVFH